MWKENITGGNGELCHNKLLEDFHDALSTLLITAFKSLLIIKLLIFLPYVSFVPSRSALFSFPSQMIMAGGCFHPTI